MSDNNTLQRWYVQQPGVWVKNRECAEVSNVMRRLLGDSVLQIGGTTDLMHAKDSRTTFQFGLFDECVEGDRLIHSNLYDWPIQRESVDITLLVHRLEFIRHPVKLLRDIYESLKPGGHVIVFGFNPWSLAGLRQVFQFKKTIPWSGKFWSRSQVKQWLRKCDFTVLSSKTFCFRWWSCRAPTRRETLWTETLGQLLMPSGGGVYMIVAQKKTYASIRRPELRWKKQPIMRKVANPTTRA